MTATIWAKADRVLRTGTLRDERTLSVLELLALVVLFGLAYGAVMGMYAGISGDRLLQVVYSALKVPLLLVVTFALSLPSFFVLNSLMGLRNDFAQAVRALAATQAGLTIILSSLAPFTALWYVCWRDYPSAILFNGIMFGAASVSAQWLLRRLYAPLIARNKRHRLLLRAWIIVYAFTGIQMGWVLRPFIGDPLGPTQFFREKAFGNAYVELGKIVWKATGSIRDWGEE